MAAATVATAAAPQAKLDIRATATWGGQLLASAPAPRRSLAAAVTAAPSLPPWLLPPPGNNQTSRPPSACAADPARDVISQLLLSAVHSVDSR